VPLGFLFVKYLIILPLQVARLEMPSLVNDAVNDERVRRHFINGATEIHADLPHFFFADSGTTLPSCGKLVSALTFSAMSWITRLA